MAERRIKGSFVHLSDALTTSCGQQEWGSQWHLHDLVRHWPELVGNAFAGCSMPAFFRKDELWIYICNSLWMQQMHLSKPTIIAKINEFLRGRLVVKDLRWTLQPADMIQPVEKYTAPQPNVVDPAAEQAFRAMAENIADPTCRAALCNLWTKLESIKRR